MRLPVDVHDVGPGRGVGNVSSRPSPDWATS
jgi:hypothetical protein